MNITNDPLDLEPKRRMLMLHFLLEVTTEEERLGGNLMKTLSVSIVTRKDKRRLTVGQKAVERKDKDLEQRQRKKNRRKKWPVL